MSEAWNIIVGLSTKFNLSHYSRPITTNTCVDREAEAGLLTCRGETEGGLFQLYRCRERLRPSYSCVEERLGPAYSVEERLRLAYFSCTCSPNQCSGYVSTYIGHALNHVWCTCKTCNVVVLFIPFPSQFVCMLLEFVHV